jgi:hypothetical protein
VEFLFCRTCSITPTCGERGCLTISLATELWQHPVQSSEYKSSYWLGEVVASLLFLKPSCHPSRAKLYKIRPTAYQSLDNNQFELVLRRIFIPNVISAPIHVSVRCWGLQLQEWQYVVSFLHAYTASDTDTEHKTLHNSATCFRVMAPNPELIHCDWIIRSTALNRARPHGPTKVGHSPSDKFGSHSRFRLRTGSVQASRFIRV